VKIFSNDVIYDKQCHNCNIHICNTRFNIRICNTRSYHRWISTVISVQCVLLGYEYDLNLYHSIKLIFHVSLFICFYVASVITACWWWQLYHSWTLICASKINVLFSDEPMLSIISKGHLLWVNIWGWPWHWVEATTQSSIQCLLNV
jgi:hypothetical protein